MVTVTAAGRDITCDIDSDVIVDVGRAQVREKGQASYAALTVRPAASGQLLAPFDPITITAGGRVRFAGHIAEVDLQHELAADGTSTAVQRVAAMGPLASWGSTTYGAPPWPEETVADRANRIADLIGQPVVVQGGGTLQVAPRDVDSQTAWRLLTDLADATGGWVFDHAGNVYLQALDARRVDAGAVTWDDEPVGQPWDSLDGTLTWLDEDDNPYQPISLPACDALWGAAWYATTEIANAVRVTYIQDGENEVVVEDTDSIATYGRHEIKQESTFADQGDALTLAATILERNRLPLFAFTGVTVDVPDLPPPLAADLLAMAPGARIELTGLPGPVAPATGFLGCVEGWRETLSPGGGHRMVLRLSDVRHSLAVPTWDAEPVDALWNDLDTTATWEGDF